MHPDAERFIDLATRHLPENAELQLTARAELEKALKTHVADHPDALTLAADALDRADGRTHRKRWVLLLYAVTLLISLPLIVHTVKQLMRTSGVTNLISPLSFGTTELPKIQNLDPQQSLLLYGDETAGNDSERWKALWESEPDNAAYLAEYAGMYFRDHKDLSPEILEAAARVDPDNGWFLAFAAVAAFEGAVTREKRSARDTADGKAPVMTIHDEDRLNETLAILHQAVSKPRFTSYQSQLFAERISLFPPRRDFVSQIPAMAHAGTVLAPGIPFRKLADAFAAGAQQSAAVSDVEGFRRIADDWRAWALATTKGGDTLIDLLIAKVMIAGPATNFRDAAQSLGLAEEAQYFAALDEQFREEKKARDRRKGLETPEEDFFRKKSSILSGLAGPLVGRQVKTPPALTDLDLRPARYVDHGMAGRMLSFTGWILLGVAVASAFAGRRRRNPMAGALGTRFVDLLRASDWAWILGLGVIAPVVWYGSITRLTPLSAREWTVTYMTFIPLAGQFTCLLLSLIILPPVVASGRLAGRASALGLKPRHPWMGWVAAGAALAGVPAFGAIPLARWTLVPAFCLVGLAVMWIVSGLIVNFMGRPRQELRRATLARVVMPAWVAGMLAFAAFVPLHHAEERYWIQLDRLGEVTAEAPALSRYEYDVTQILRSELLEMLGEAPGSR